MSKTFRKLGILFVMVALVLSLAACGPEKDEVSISDVDEIAGINVEFGTEADAAIDALPATVEVTLSNDEVKDAPLAWEAPEDYDGEVPGNYKFDGTFTIDEGNGDVEATVTVLEEDIDDDDDDELLLSVETVNVDQNTLTAVIEAEFSQAVDEAENAGISVAGDGSVQNVDYNDDNTVLTITVSGFIFGSYLDFSDVTFEGEALLDETFEEIDTLDLIEPDIELTIENDVLNLYPDGANESTNVVAEAVGFPEGTEVVIDFSANFGQLSILETSTSKVSRAKYTPDDRETEITDTITAKVTEVKNPSTGEQYSAYVNIDVASASLLLLPPGAGDGSSGQVVLRNLEIASATATQTDRLTVTISGVNEANEIIDNFEDVDSVLDILEPGDFTVTNDIYAGDNQVAVERVVKVGDNQVLLVLDGPDNNVVDGEGDVSENFPLKDNTLHKVEFSSETNESITVDDVRYTISFNESSSEFFLEDNSYLRIMGLYNADTAPARYNLNKDELLVVFNESVNAMIDDENSIFNLYNWVIDGFNLGNRLPGYSAFKSSAEEPFVEMRLLSSDGDDPTNGINKDAVAIRFTEEEVEEADWGLNRQEFLNDDQTHLLQVNTVGDWASVTNSANIVATQEREYEGIEIDETKVALISDNSPEQFIVVFSEPVGSTEDGNISIEFGEDTINYEDNLFEVTPIREGLVYLIEMNEDWTQIYDTETSGENYHNNSKNKVKLTASGIKDFWGYDDVTIESNEIELDVDESSPRPVVMEAITTEKEDTDNFDLSTIDLSAITFDINSDFVTRDDIMFDLNVESDENDGAHAVNQLADAGSVLVVMNEPVQWKDNDFDAAGTNGTDYVATTPLTPSQQQAADDGVDIATFEYRQLEDSDGNEIDGVTIEGRIAEVTERDYYSVVNPVDELANGKWQLTMRSLTDDVGNSVATENAITTFVVTTAEEEVVTDPDEIDKKLPFELLGVDAHYDVTGWLDEYDSDTDNGEAKDIIHILFTEPLAGSGDNSALRKMNYNINGEPMPVDGSRIEKGIIGDDRYIGTYQIEYNDDDGNVVTEERIRLVDASYYASLSDEAQANYEPVARSSRAVTIVLPDGYLEGRNENHTITINNIANVDGDIYQARVQMPYGIETADFTEEGSETVNGLNFAPDGDYSEVDSNDNPFGHYGN